MSLKNVFGDIGLEKTLQKIAFYLGAISNNIAKMYPDTSGRTRVNVETGALSSVGTLSNISATGGYNAQYDQYAQIQSTITPIRAQIKVT
jgi:hypothetical protein